jgi:hypothetical protein
MIDVRTVVVIANELFGNDGMFKIRFTVPNDAYAFIPFCILSHSLPVDYLQVGFHDLMTIVTIQIETSRPNG